MRWPKPCRSVRSMSCPTFDVMVRDGCGSIRRMGRLPISERRWATRRSASAGWRGLAGWMLATRPMRAGKLFEEVDRAHLEAGLDWVKTLEQPAGNRERIAQQQANGQVRALDQAIAAGADKRQRLKLLDAEIAKLAGPTQTARDAVAQQLRSEVTDTNRGIVRMLDQLSAGEPDDRVRTLDGLSPVLDSASLYDRIHQHMAANGLPRTHFAKLLDQYTITGALPETPAPAEPEIPPGVHAGSHELDKRVRDRMRELDAPESDYVKVLEQVMKGNV